MGIKITQVDAFTDRPFAGNPAAVCILAAAANGANDEAWMQSVAREMNLSETAFLWPEADGFRLRWMTPETEVSLCGHATLASAHVLWEEGHLPPRSTALFYTRSGLLTADRKPHGIEMNFPAVAPDPAPTPAGLADALGASIVCVAKNIYDYIVELDSEDAVRSLEPDFTALKRLDARAIIVTSRSESSEYDFVSRCFGPRVGVNEDPVTGSAHCALAPYWSRQLGKTEFIAFQASARSGIVRVRLEGDRAILGGQAVTVFRGELVSC